MKWFIVAFFSILFSSPSWALLSWQEKGNGGDIIVCKSPQGNLMYDSYETEVRHKLSITLPEGTNSPTDSKIPYSGFEDLDTVLVVAQEVLNRVHEKDPELAQTFTQTLGKFKTEVRFVADSILVDIEDFGMGYIPNNCELKQLIIQRNPKFPSDKRYTIALDLWKTLSIRQKAIGVVHEVLYNYALSLNPRVETSEPIRYFNALLLSDSLKTLSSAQYRDLKYEIFLWIY